MKNLFIFKDNKKTKIITIEKQYITKYTQSWIFITKDETFTIKDDIRFIYECFDCGKLSLPIKNYKKIVNQKKLLCSSCCKKGKRNPFYNKKHSNETISKIKITTSSKSKELWKNKEYRNKVINGISKPRKISFKKEQSERITKWYKDNPKQREIRSKSMKKSWDNGCIIPNPSSINRSKGEIKLFEYLSRKLSAKVEEKRTIFVDEKWFLPDIIINDNIIVEYFGDYWHGNPKLYKRNDLIAHKVLAKDVWKRDKNREEILKKNGYNIIVVWSSDNYKESDLIENIENFYR